MGIIYIPTGNPSPQPRPQEGDPPTPLPPEKKSPTFSGFAQPSFFAQPGWVNPHMDVVLNLAPPDWNGAGLYSELQPWNLAVDPTLNWAQLILTSPRLTLGDDSFFQVRFGKFDRDYSILPTPVDVLDFDETTLTPSTTLPGSIEVFGGQGRFEFAGDATTVALSGGFFAGLPVDGHAPDSIGSGTLSLAWTGDAVVPGSLAVGAGAINAPLLSDDSAAAMDTDVRASSAFMQGGIHQALVPGGGPFGVYGALLAGYQTEPGYDDFDTQYALTENPNHFPGSNFHVIPKVGATLTTESFALDASAGQHWVMSRSDDAWPSSQEYGTTAVLTAVPDRLQIIAVGTLVVAPDETIPMIEGKVKWLFDVP